MTQSKYKDIGKKQIINVVTQVIQKVEAIEMTLNLFIKMIDKDEKFNDYMTEQLGGKDGASGNGGVDTDGDTTESTED